MTLSLSTATEQLIQKQIHSGRFRTAEEVVEAALLDLDSAAMDDTLDEEDLAAIAKADAQTDRGEVTSLEEIRAEYELKYKPVR